MFKKRARIIAAAVAFGAIVAYATPAMAIEKPVAVADAPESEVGHKAAAADVVVTGSLGFGLWEAPQLGDALNVNLLSPGASVSLGSGAETQATAACARRPDFYNSCVCPSSYQVVVYWTSTSTGASNMWSGSSQTHMTQNRGPGSGWPNPVTKYGTGNHAHYTGRQGPVYYARGGGAAGAVVSQMWAVCSQVFLASA